MEALRNPVRPYAWGSRTAIAAIRGEAVPSATPQAEMWMGAHPGGPSMLVRDDAKVSLRDAIDADPGAMLGAANVARFGARLPFLLKLLAADEPLSLQAHPDAAQARAGYDEEVAAGLPPAERNYGDPYHKPELVVAVSEFEGLCGFRDTAVSAEYLARLSVPGLTPVVEALRTCEPGQGLREAMTLLLTLPDGPRVELTDHVTTAAAQLAGDDAAHADYALVVDLGKRYPGDVGAVVSLLLNHVWLRPGDGLYMPAGNLHLYLRGVGVEVMAASDNVLRGGLTPKRVDVPELLRVLRFEVLDDAVLSPVPLAPGVDGWATPMPDFALSRAQVGGTHPRVTLPAADVPGPRILFCLYGRVQADDGETTVDLGPGDAAFVRAGREPVSLTGFGTVFQATTR